MSGTYAPVPYDVGFSLNVYIKNIEDGTNIIEQILPYFTPEFTVTLKSATDLGLKQDLPVILTAVTMEDNFEGGFDDRRIITWTLDFILKGMLYGSVRDSKIIKKSTINLRPVVNTISQSIVNTQNTSIYAPAPLVQLTTNISSVGASSSNGSGYAAWSPDGTEIAFRSFRNGNTADIFVMNADGSNQRNLTQNNITADWYPTWSPDGTKIAFNSTRSHPGTANTDVYVMNRDGTDIRACLLYTSDAADE